MATNRIMAAVARMEDQISERIALGLTTKSAVEKSNRQLDMSYAEWALFQERKSLACAGGVLTPDEANYVFGLLGSTPDHFNRQPIAAKYVLTGLLRELLERSASRPAAV